MTSIAAWMINDDARHLDRDARHLAALREAHETDHRSLARRLATLRDRIAGRPSAETACDPTTCAA